MENSIQPHNQRPAAVWSSGGSAYDKISRGIADSIEHCVLRLDPQPGERILDLRGSSGDRQATSALEWLLPDPERPLSDTR